MFLVGWKLTAKIRLACPAEDGGSTPSITAIGKLTATSLFTKIGFCVFNVFRKLSGCHLNGCRILL